MGCILGPNNQIMLDRARFFFDASQPWANRSATVFLNPFFNTSYGNYTIDSDTNFVAIAGTGVSKFLDFKQYQQFKTGATATGTFNAVTSFSWMAIVKDGNGQTSNMFFRCDDFTGNFTILDNGNFVHGHAGVDYTSTGLTLDGPGWKHLALTRNGTSCILYVNGVSSYTYTLGGNNTTTDYSYRIGTYPGSIVDVAYLMWLPGHTMTVAEVQYNYNLLKNRFGLS
jgi:hypothetical protein